MGASICLCQGPSRAVLNLHLVRRSGVEMQTLPVNNENPVKSVVQVVVFQASVVFGTPEQQDLWEEACTHLKTVK